MKKLFLLLGFFITSSMLLQAQHIGIQGGGVLSNVSWRNDLATLNTKIKPGFLAGITLDIPLNNSMVINTAINYKTMGTWLNDSTDLASFNLGYVNLDATYNYIFDMKSFQIYAEGGGYISYLVIAKSIYKPTNEDRYTEDLKIGTSEDDDLGHLDLGLTIGAGVYLGKFKFGVGYQAGVLDVSHSNDYIFINRMGYLRAAYFFNR